MKGRIAAGFSSVRTLDGVRWKVMGLFLLSIDATSMHRPGTEA